ncbi:mucosal addressin cell adhesion molecule 1 [Hyla sarda]|uniref:mucosal addressin cell adhesion molecule 1 n=1 Tax=Hyla sarda TaxID=327740 RepID=UPI0024C2244D|nr:mucosal addressin cell adhesion molecule 1 [Hyla sarda]
MASSLLSFIILLLFILSNAQHYLTVHPKDTVVSIGTSIQLNCSINCHSGIVMWKGLDNADNRHYVAPGYSVMTLENIRISMEGTRICVGSCPGYRKVYQRSVELRVYALPETLLLSNSMKNGVHYLNCSMKHVYPPPEITCYRGTERLGESIDIEEVQEVDELYNVMWSWEIPETEETTYRCEAQLNVNDHVLTREGTLKLSNKEETTTAVPASSTPQIISTSSWKLETPYVTTFINASQTIPEAQKDTKIGSHHSTTPGRYTNTVTIQTTQAPTKSSSTEKTTLAVPASSTSQILSTIAQKETSYVTATINASQNAQALPRAQKDTTIGSHQLTSPEGNTKVPIINTVFIQNTRPTQTPTKPIYIDGHYFMWTVVPATCLVGSFLLSLIIYRQLNKKGFFQPNHLEFPTDKKITQSQGNFQTEFCYDNSNIKEISEEPSLHHTPPTTVGLELAVTGPHTASTVVMATSVAITKHGRPVVLRDFVL